MGCEALSREPEYACTLCKYALYQGKPVIAPALALFHAKRADLDLVMGWLSSWETMKDG